MITRADPLLYNGCPVTIPSNSGHRFWLSRFGGHAKVNDDLSQSLPIQVINSDGITKTICLCLQLVTIPSNSGHKFWFRRRRPRSRAHQMSQSLPIQVINSDALIAIAQDWLTESQSLPIQVINSDSYYNGYPSSPCGYVTIPSNSGHKFWSDNYQYAYAAQAMSQSLPIQVINSDAEEIDAAEPHDCEVTIPSNSGHKFWSRHIFSKCVIQDVTIPSNSGHKFWFTIWTAGEKNSPAWSQSLPIQVINSDLLERRRINFQNLVTIPSNSGHKFWLSKLEAEMNNPASVTIPSNSGHKFWSGPSLFLGIAINVTIPSNSGHKFWYEMTTLTCLECGWVTIPSNSGHKFWFISTSALPTTKQWSHNPFQFRS